MRISLKGLALAAFAAFCAFDAFAGIVYVSATSGDDSNDGSSWALAKQTIQAGVDAAASNDTVLVTNGTYNTGGSVPPGQVLCKARVVITNGVSVISVNGPSNTFIVGQGPRGENAVRCAWMASNTFLMGFTLTNGYTATVPSGADQNGGGVYATSASGISNCIINFCTAGNGGGAYYGNYFNCSFSYCAAGTGGGGYLGIYNNCTFISNSATGHGGGATANALINCTLTGNSAGNYGGGAAGGMLSNCTLTANSASSGGGVAFGTLYNCVITANTANEYGGGAYGLPPISPITMNNCIITGNSANLNGGGISMGTLNNCTIAGNSAPSGGGARESTLNNCTLVGNQASNGGGSNLGTLNNCALTRNSASISGGGARDSVLNNCTLYANTNGGVFGGTAMNAISYGNTEYDIMTNVSFAVCFTNNPLFVDAASNNLRLQSNSPCINAGQNAFAPTNTPYDLDGNPRIISGSVDIGAYEYQGFDFIDLVASAGSHGSIVPSGLIRTNQGANVSFDIQPDTYYHVENIFTNGGSAGAVTNFTWYNVSASGTVTVSFAATLAARGTPHWWLAQWGWTNNFDVVESLDQDGDGLFTWEEYPPNTCPTNANTDGDQYDDGVEVSAGADPLRNDSQTYGAMQAHPASFSLYTSNSVLDLSYGEMMVQMVSNTIHVRLTMQSTDMLDGDGWTNVGTAVEWECPADLNKSFFRFLGTPVE